MSSVSLKPSLQPVTSQPQPTSIPKHEAGSLGPREVRQVKAEGLPKQSGTSGSSRSGSGSLGGGSQVKAQERGVIRQSPVRDGSPPPSVQPGTKKDVRSRVLTEKELVQKMGKTPAWDRRQFLFFGKVTWQSNYKQTLNELRAYNSLVASTKLSDDPATRQEQLKTLKGKLDEVAKRADNYLAAKHKQKYKEVMTDLKKQIGNEKTLLDKVMSDPKATAGTGLSWGAAVELARHSVPIGRHSDMHGLEDANLQGKPKVLGAGAFNTVLKATYNTGDSTVTRVIKPLPAEEVGRRGAVASATGIPRDSPRYGQRNIAASLVNDTLGLSVMPKCSFAMHQGRLALAMEVAPGKTADDMLYERGPRLARNPAVQKQVNDLEWLDAIMGQGDRHHNNYMIHVGKEGSVKVTGIDNDQCAGKDFTDPNTALKHKSGEKAGKLCGHNIGLPPIISKELARKLAATDFDRDIRPGLGELLDKGEIDAMKSRFNAAKSKAAQLDQDGYAISDWATWKAPSSAPHGAGEHVFDFLCEQPKVKTSAGSVPPSYLARDFSHQSSDSFGGLL